MWIFKKKKRHISVKMLSEHLDRRLGADERQRIEGHLEVCSRCREELGSLEHTIGLLRRVPTVAPRRVFTLAEAPSAIPTPRKASVPIWAYGAAASVAVLLFALVLSADLSGLLAQDVSVPTVSGLAVETPPSPTPSPVAAAKAVEAQREIAAAPPGLIQETEAAKEPMTPSPPSAADVPVLTPGEAAPGSDTATIWRVLEGVFGGIALILVGWTVLMGRRLWRRSHS